MQVQGVHLSLQSYTGDNDAHNMLRITLLELKCEHASELAGGLVKADCQGSLPETLIHQACPEPKNVHF